MTGEPCPDARTDGSGSSSAHRRFTTQDGLALFYREYGDPRSPEPAILCLPGLTRNGKDFHAFAAHVAAGRRVICPDYRGRGRSQYDPNWRNYRPATYINDLHHLLAAARAHRVVVVGTSLGGLLAMAMAASMPTTLAGAVLNDIGPEIEAGSLDPIIAYMKDARPVDGWQAAVERLRRTYPGAPARTDDEWLEFTRATYRERADGRLQFDWDPAIVKPLAREGARAVRVWHLFRALGRVPVIAVRGAESKILSRAVFERMSDAFPGLERITVPAVGHAPRLDEPRVLEAVARLLEA